MIFSYFFHLRGSDFDDIDEEMQKEVAVEMLVCDKVVALAADPKSCESFYLIKIAEEEKEKAVEGLFLERKFNFDNLYTIPKKG